MTRLSKEREQINENVFTQIDDDHSYLADQYRKRCSELALARQEQNVLTAKFHAMMLVADDHAIARIHKQSQIDQLKKDLQVQAALTQQMREALNFWIYNKCKCGGVIALCEICCKLNMAYNTSLTRTEEKLEKLFEALDEIIDCCDHQTEKCECSDDMKEIALNARVEWKE